MVLAHFAGDVGENDVAVFELHPVSGVGEDFDNDAFKLN